MKQFLLLILIIISGNSLVAQLQKYARILIPADPEYVNQIVLNGIPLEPGIIERDSLILEISDKQLVKMNALNIPYNIRIPDLGRFYANRNKNASLKIDRHMPGEYAIPEGWQLGSMGGMYTYDEILAELDTMKQLYPELITGLNQIGDHTSIEGRPLFWMKISDNPEVNEDEPELMYTALHHAREGIGVQQLIYYMYYLLENYETDSLIQGLINSTEMYFIPVVNPDGYVYNQNSYPHGGGMWRKNRRDNGDGTFGVDLNRNYGYMWGYDDFGSSPYTEDETYRGTEAFSEPEVQAVKAFCDSNDFKMALNYHSYGNYLLYPWGYISATCEDDPVFSTHARLMTRDNKYTYGAGGIELYRTNGGSDDWMYGGQSGIFAYTPEVGSSSDGFWPAISRIIPLCRENVYQNIMAARLSGHYAEAEDTSPNAIGDLEGSLGFYIKRFGLSAGGNYSVRIEPLNNAIIETGAPVDFNNLGLFEKVAGEISYRLNPGLETGDEIQYLLKLSNGSITDTDTITKIYGQTVAVFEDDCNSTEHWSGVWHTTTNNFYSPAASITDSPNGNYPNNMFIITTMENEIDLSGNIFAELSFMTKWDIKTDGDCVQLLISADNGNSWQPLQGKYTRSSNSSLFYGQPVYEGVQEDWVKETVALDEYLGKTVKFRFMLRSNNLGTADGFYFDDFTVSVLSDLTPVSKTFAEAEVLQVFPNPANEKLSFISSGNLSGQLKIYDANARLVYRQHIRESRNQIDVDTQTWPQGLYFYHFHGESLNASGKISVH